jgi:molecular chaperone GrpE
MLSRFTTRAVVRSAAPRTAMASAAAWCPRRFQSEDAKPAEGDAKADADAKKPAEEEKVDKSSEILKEKDEEIKDLKSKLLYAVAETETARRIAREDVQKAKDFSVTSISKDMLDVADTLAGAADAFNKIPKAELDGHKQLNAVLTGVKMSMQVLGHQLGRHGIEKMEVAAGDKFDPNQHDALFNAPVTDKINAGEVSTIVKTGYMLKERVLRAAQVGVAQKSVSAPPRARARAKPRRASCICGAPLPRPMMVHDTDTVAPPAQRSGSIAGCICFAVWFFPYSCL